MASRRNVANVNDEPVEGPWDLPDGWRWERLGDCLPLEYGKALSAKNRSSDGGHPVFGSSGAVGVHDEALTAGPTVVVGRKGSAGAVHFSEVGCWPIDTAYYVRPRAGIDLRYAFHLLTHLRLGSLDQSTAIPSLSRNNYSSLVVPVADEKLQPRISARIDALFAEIDEGEAALARARAGVETYRKALLKAAVTGELTADWRAANPPQETGEQLLARILADRRARWHADPKNARKTYTEPAEPDTDGLPELPQGWCYAPIGTVTDCLDSQRVPVSRKIRDERKGSIPYYGANGQTGWIDDHLFDERLVLVVEDETFTGREKDFSYIIEGKSWVNNHAHILRAGPFMDTDYLNTTLARYPFTPLTTGTTGRKKLTQAALNKAPLPVPPLAEQIQLVALLRSHINKEAALAAELAPADAVQSLRQSILAAAFRGELTA